MLRHPVHSLAPLTLYGHIMGFLTGFSVNPITFPQKSCKLTTYGIRCYRSQGAVGRRGNLYFTAYCEGVSFVMGLSGPLHQEINRTI